MEASASVRQNVNLTVGQLAAGKSVREKLSVFVKVLNLLSTFIAVPVFVCLKLDGYITWSWGRTLTPLWICDAVVFPILLIVNVRSAKRVVEETPLIVGDYEVEESVTVVPKKVVILRIFFLACYLLVQIFIALRLDHVIDWQWWVVFIPLYCVPSSKVALQAFLVACKLNGLRNVPWRWVLLPSLIFFAFKLVQSPWKAYHNTDAKQQSRVYMSRGLEALANFTSYLVLLTTLIITIYRLDYAVFSAIYIALPFFIVVGVAILTGLVFVFTSNTQQSTVTLSETV